MSQLEINKKSGCACAHGHEHGESEHQRERRDPHEHCEHHEHKDDKAEGAQTKADAIDPALLATASPTRAIYRIVNMDCPMEEALIRQELAKIEGIDDLTFKLGPRLLIVDHHLGSTEPIVQALQAIDMTPQILTADSKVNLKPIEIPWQKLAVALLLAGAAEGFHLAHEWQRLPGEWSLYLALALAVVSIFLSGFKTYKKGWSALIHGHLNINALMAVAVTGAVLIGQYPEAAMVMVLFNVAEAIEAKALDKARQAVKELVDLTPPTATVWDGKNWVEKPLEAVRLGDKVRVRPGEKIALDGVVLSGQSTVNQAPITGESLPKEKSQGDYLYAGTINQDGALEYEVKTKSSESTVAKIIRAVEEAQNTKAPIQRFVDVFAQYYTPAIFILAVLMALVPPLVLGSSWSDSIYKALVILVIGCPCALVISTPVSIVSGMAAAAKSGVLVKGGSFLEQGRLLNWIALDKTGTITKGQPQQTDFLNLSPLPDQQAQSLASSLASYSDHPVSKAIAQHAQESALPLHQVQDFQNYNGRGVGGKIKGQQWYLGSHRLVEELKLCSKELESKIFPLEKEGKSVVALVNEHGPQGVLAVADTPKESSLEAIQELKKLGVKTLMLTGDNDHTAQRVAKEVGVDDYQSNLLPGDKLAVVEKLESQGNHVGMVGDGINDSPALARANIGFAMAGGGTDTAIETADIALMDDDLRKIPRFILLSRSTYAIVVQNIALALGIKAVFFVLTLAGQTTMWMAVFADVGAALLVVANGLRALRK